MTYFLRWGSNGYQQFWLDGLSSQTHYNVYELSAEIKFNDNFSGVPTWKTFTLYHNDAHDTHCEHAKQYHFDWTDTDGCFSIFNGTCNH